jgi:hypothetical protein
MPASPEPGIEVVKVQQALYPPGGDALIYDQDRKHLQQRPLTAAERHMMAGEVRAFFQASWNTPAVGVGRCSSVWMRVGNRFTGRFSRRTL